MKGDNLASRSVQGNDLYREMIESGVIKTGDKAAESKCTLVYGQMNEPPGARARVALTGQCFAFLRPSAMSCVHAAFAGYPWLLRISAHCRL